LRQHNSTVALRGGRSPAARGEGTQSRLRAIERPTLDRSTSLSACGVATVSESPTSDEPTCIASHAAALSRPRICTSLMQSVMNAFFWRRARRAARRSSGW